MFTHVLWPVTTLWGMLQWLPQFVAFIAMLCVGAFVLFVFYLAARIFRVLWPAKVN